MDQLDPIPNKVANSKLITLSFEDFYPKGERRELDIAPWLFEGVMLREKDFREHLKQHDWSQYKDAFVAVYCSADAIIPQWAYMLLGTYLQGVATKWVYGNREVLEGQLMENVFHSFDFSAYRDERIILKGCSDLPIPPHAYLSFAAHLAPYAKSIMFGEACSTVPIFKKK
jgi:hypothetical protein